MSIFLSRSHFRVFAGIRAGRKDETELFYLTGRYAFSEIFEFLLVPF